jgi:hypothetical protein
LMNEVWAKFSIDSTPPPPFLLSHYCK